MRRPGTIAQPQADGRIYACRGYFAHDVKPLFDPVDYIIFDGMHASSAVTRIVLFDGPALGHARERVQRSIQRHSRRAITSGRPCGWEGTAGFSPRRG